MEQNQAVRSPEVIQVNLVCCTNVILNEIKQGLPQKAIALTYAMAMRSAAQGADCPDWPLINVAILNRWSASGLESVKARAWKIFQGKIAP